MRHRRPLLAGLAALALVLSGCGDDADREPDRTPPQVPSDDDLDESDRSPTMGDDEVQDQLPPEDPDGRTDDTVDRARPTEEPEDPDDQDGPRQNPGLGG